MCSVTSGAPEEKESVGSLSENRRDKTHERIISRTSIRERKRVRRINDGPFKVRRWPEAYSSSSSLRDFFDFLADFSALAPLSFLDFFAGFSSASSSPLPERI